MIRKKIVISIGDDDVLCGGCPKAVEVKGSKEFWRCKQFEKWIELDAKRRPLRIDECLRRTLVGAHVMTTEDVISRWGASNG